MAAASTIILASGSIARRQMLASAGVLFSVVPADVDEAAIKASMTNESDCVDGDQLAGVLARAKAEAVSALHREAIVIGADQVLSLGTRLFDKPADLQDARATLDRLRGRTHELHSAVAIARHGVCDWVLCQSARLTMRAFSDEFLDSYIARVGQRICDSVGAYEIEGFGLQLFEHIEGDTFTIMGMPLLALLAELRARGALAT